MSLPENIKTKPAANSAHQKPSLAEATRVWAKIALLSFGGPAGQIALMHRIVVEEKGWISEERFLHALNFCMLLPGPEAQQLATYIGWLLHKVRGGLIAGLLFILPGFLVILGLSYLYVTTGNLPIVQGLFLGLKAAVIIIVLQAVIRIGQRSLKSAIPIILAVSAFLAMYIWKLPFPLVILAAAIAGAISAHYTKPTEDLTHEAGASDSFGAGYLLRTTAVFGFLWLAPVVGLAALMGPDNVFTNIGQFFSKMAVVTFGGAYAVLSYVSQEAVTTFQWLQPGEMIDGLAMAETTPGPLIMVTQFVGFMAAYRDPGTLNAAWAALLGGTLTTWVTFMPCFLWIFIGAPFIERLRGNQLLSNALSGVTAAVVGVIVNLALWFAIHTLFEQVSVYQAAGASFELPVLSTLNIPALVLALIAALLVFRFKASVLTVLGVAGVLGMGLSLIVA